MATWYVRPNTSHNSTRDGSSYETAWGGWSEVVWGGGGVSPSDVLRLCGPHAYGANITVGAHGAANVSERVSITGDYPADPGSVVFTSASMIVGQSWTTIDKIDFTMANNNIPCLSVLENVDGLRVSRSRFTAVGTGTCIRFSVTSASTWTATEIEENEFTGALNAGGSAVAMESLLGNVYIVDDFVFRKNHLYDITTGLAGLRLTIGTSTAVGSKLKNIVVEDNYFYKTRGVGVFVQVGGSKGVINEGLRISGNVFDGLFPNTVPDGGAILATGFGASAELGNPEVSYNTILNTSGRYGGMTFEKGANLQVFGNYINGLTSDATNRAHGITVSDVTDAAVYRNVVMNVTGVPAVADSGTGLQLRSGGGLRAQVYNNLFANCRAGLHFNSVGVGSVVEHNTILDCKECGFHSTTTSINNVVAQNNLLSGSGPSVLVTSTAWSLEDYNAFCGFDAASGHTLGANSITPALPKLTDGGKPDAGSVLEGAGTTTARATDFLGAARSTSAPTIGAMEAESSTLARDSGDTTYSNTGPQSPVIPELWQNVPMRARLKYRNHWKDSPWYAAG